MCVSLNVCLCVCLCVCLEKYSYTNKQTTHRSSYIRMIIIVANTCKNGQHHLHQNLGSSRRKGSYPRQNNIEKTWLYLQVTSLARIYIQVNNIDVSETLQVPSRLKHHQNLVVFNYFCVIYVSNKKREGRTWKEERRRWVVMCYWHLTLLPLNSSW